MWRADSDVSSVQIERYFAALIRILVFLLNRASTHGLTRVYTRQEFADGVMEFLSQNNGRWDGVLKFLIALAEAMQIFKDSNKTDAKGAQVLDLVTRWRNEILCFVGHL
jgi:hypothetical protein